MPTTNFAFADAGLVPGGYFAAAATQGGRSARQQAGRYGQLDFVATGTDCTVNMYYTGATPTFTVSVDGGAPTSLTMPSVSTWGAVTLFTGLSDAAHTVSVKATSTANSTFFDTTNCLAVTGAAPALAVPTGFSKQLYAFRSATVATPYTDVTAYLAASPGMTLTTADGYGCYQTSWIDSQIDLPSGSCDTLKLWCLQSGNKYCLRVDGANQATVADANNAQWGWLTLATGLSTSGTHAYSIHALYSSGSQRLYGVMAVGGSGLTGTAPAAAKETWAWYGDSIVRGQAGTANDSSLAFAHECCRRGSVWCANRGFPSSTVKQFGSGVAANTTAAGEATTRITDLTGLTAIVGGVSTPVSPAKVICLYGTNDMGQAGGAETAADYQASYATMLGRIRAGLPAATLYNLGILNRAGFTPGPWNTAMQAALAAAGLAGTFIDTSAWTNTTTDLFDGTHPNGTGYAKMVAKLYPALAGFRAYGRRPGGGLGGPRYGRGAGILS